MNRVMLLASGAVVAALSLTAAALGQTPAGQVYNGEAGNVQQGVAGDVAGGAGTLPFTGVDLLLMAVAAALLVGAGLTIRRLARTKA
jgi:hypothetical protein